MKGQTNSFVLKNRLQGVLRNNMTNAELVLWKRLRGRQIGGRKFRRQHPFGDFIVDFVCLEAKLVIEVDGGQHNESAKDAVRDQALAKAGFSVMRFWNNQVLDELESVVEMIWLALEPHPHPNPPLEREGAKVEGGRSPAHPTPPLEGEGANVGGGRSPAHHNHPLEGEGANVEGGRPPAQPDSPTEGKGK